MKFNFFTKSEIGFFAKFVKKIAHTARDGQYSAIKKLPDENFEKNDTKRKHLQRWWQHWLEKVLIDEQITLISPQTARYSLQRLVIITLLMLERFQTGCKLF